MPMSTSEANTFPPDTEPSRRDRLRRWGQRVLVAAVLLALLLLTIRELSPSPQKQRAAFDAAHAIPDQDNAALIYGELLTGEEVPPSKLEIAVSRFTAKVMDPMSFLELGRPRKKLRELELSEGISDPNAAWDIAGRPWRTQDCPELKRWLDQRKDRLERLREAARKPACCFPLCPTPGRLDLFDMPLDAFRQNVSLLRWAANNDFGEGDSDAGLEKCQDLVSIGRHLRGQPSRSCLVSGIAYEVAALHRLAEFVVEGPATKRQLDDLAQQYAKIENEWESIIRDIKRVRSIYVGLLTDERPIRFRVGTWLGRIRGRYDDVEEARTHVLYLRLLSEQQGLRMLIELRRCKDRTGQWPAGLDAIASALPSEILVDPGSNRPYVYKLSGEGFSLYSIGPNRIDEGGRNKWKGPDDWLIWPLRDRTPKPEPQDANNV